MAETSSKVMAAKSMGRRTAGSRGKDSSRPSSRHTLKSVAGAVFATAKSDKSGAVFASARSASASAGREGEEGGSPHIPPTEEPEQPEESCAWVMRQA